LCRKPRQKLGKRKQDDRPQCPSLKLAARLEVHAAFLPQRDSSEYHRAHRSRDCHVEQQLDQIDDDLGAASLPEHSVVRFGGYCTPAVQLKSKRGLSGLSAGGLIALDPFTRIRHLPFQGRVPRSSNSRSPSAAYRESAPPVCGQRCPTAAVSRLASERAARTAHPPAARIQTIAAAHALRFFSRPALAQGDGNSSTASPSWRGTRSGWHCPSSAGIAGPLAVPMFLSKSSVECGRRSRLRLLV